MSLEFRTLQPEEFYRQHVEAGVRPDGRHLAERRAMAVSAGNISMVRIFKCFFFTSMIMFVPRKFDKYTAPYL